MPTRSAVYHNLINDFYKGLQTEFPVISDIEFRPDVIINQDKYLCKGLIFINCEFQGQTAFSNLDIRLGIRFIDCSFKKDCSFAHLKGSGIQDNFNGDNNGIYFENCTHEGALIFNDVQLERSVKLTKQQSLKGLIIHALETQGFDIFQSQVDLLDVNLLNARLGLRIEQSEIIGQGRYFNCHGGGFTFMGSSCKRDHFIASCPVQSITTNDGIFEDDLQIKACKADTYSFIGTEFKRGLTITTLDQANTINAVIKSLYVKDCDLKGGFNFKGHRPGNLLANLEKVTLVCSNLLTGSLTFEATDIGAVNLTGTNATASINFQRCNFGSIILDHFINQGRLYFAEVECTDRKNSRLSIAKTSLGAAIFLNVNLLHFNEILIKHSHLTDIIFTDVKWFKPGQLNPLTSYKDQVNVDEIYQFKKGLQETDYRRWALTRANKEVYRQLKYASNRLGDNVQALIFQGEEMKLYKAELGFYRHTWQYSGTQIMMWLNQSNDYGNDWVKPIILLLASNFPFYCFITLLESGRFYLWPSINLEDIKATWVLLTERMDAYWAFLNPVRRLSDIYTDQRTFSAWVIFWDYLNRIVVSYFIFQIVSAFRKYTKGG